MMMAFLKMVNDLISDVWTFAQAKIMRKHIKVLQKLKNWPLKYKLK